jgi:hypothetical protein
MSKSPTTAVNGHTSPQVRAQSDIRSYAQEKSARVEERLNQLTSDFERYKLLSEMPDEALIAGIEKWYSAAEVAEFFGRSNQWIYDRFKKQKFTYRDGTLIVPMMTGGPKKPRMRFNLELIRALVDSCYRDGIVKHKELKVIMRRVAVSEFDEVVLDNE